MGWNGKGVEHKAEGWKQTYEWGGVKGGLRQ